MSDDVRKILTELAANACRIEIEDHQLTKMVRLTRVAIKAAAAQIEQQHDKLVDELIEAGKSLGIENAELKTQLQQQRERVEKLRNALIGLNREQSSEDYCFCGVAISDPNYRGEHGPCCLKARIVLAELEADKEGE